MEICWFITGSGTVVEAVWKSEKGHQDPPPSAYARVARGLAFAFPDSHIRVVFNGVRVIEGTGRDLTKMADLKP